MINCVIMPKRSDRTNTRIRSHVQCCVLDVFSACTIERAKMKAAMRAPSCILSLQSSTIRNTSAREITCSHSPIDARALPSATRVHIVSVRRVVLQCTHQQEKSKSHRHSIPRSTVSCSAVIKSAMAMPRSTCIERNSAKARFLSLVPAQTHSGNMLRCHRS